MASHLDFVIPWAGAGPDQLAPDGSASLGSSALKSTRELDAMPSHLDFQLPSSSAGPDQCSLDVTPSSGSTALQSTRNFDAMPSHVDWQSDPQLKRNDCELDTSASQGSNALKSTRELNTFPAAIDFKTAIAGSSVDQIEPNGAPSTGSTALQNTRELDEMPSHLDWQLGGTMHHDDPAFDTAPVATSALNYDFRSGISGTTVMEERWRPTSAPVATGNYGASDQHLFSGPKASAGSDALRGAREYDAMPGVFDAMSLSDGLVPLGHLGEPSAGNPLVNSARDIKPGGWVRVGEADEVLQPLAPDCIPTTFTQNLRSLQRFPREFDWHAPEKVDNPLEDLLPAIPSEHEVYVDPCKRLKEFYNRGSPLPGRSFATIKAPPTQVSPRASPQASPERETNSASGIRGRSPVVPVSTPATRARQRKLASARASPQSNSKGAVSSNMVAFLIGEEARKKRAAKRGAARGAQGKCLDLAFLCQDNKQATLSMSTRCRNDLPGHANMLTRCSVRICVVQAPRPRPRYIHKRVEQHRR